ncbi:MAG: GNAT family N-acetyltransferase [Candidatus Margulisbacteria bacterium]|nr:GNAT family N-acetyltransferase [Candidatus Margulisiibacteriota bacterium]
MIKNITIQSFKPGQEKEIYLLIKKVFDELIGIEYSAEGITSFYDFIDPQNILNRFLNKNIILLAKDNGKIVGMLETRDFNHICLFFVNKKYHHQGIGKKLFLKMLSMVKSHTKFIDVNASPYSEKIYAKLGFQKTSEQTVKNGIKFIPMKMTISSS